MRRPMLLNRSVNADCANTRPQIWGASGIILKLTLSKLHCVPVDFVTPIAFEAVFCVFALAEGWLLICFVLTICKTDLIIINTENSLVY